MANCLFCLMFGDLFRLSDRHQSSVKLLPEEFGIRFWIA